MHRTNYKSIGNESMCRAKEGWNRVGVEYVMTRPVAFMVFSPTPAVLSDGTCMQLLPLD